MAERLQLLNTPAEIAGQDGALNAWQQSTTTQLPPNYNAGRAQRFTGYQPIEVDLPSAPNQAPRDPSRYVQPIEVDPLPDDVVRGPAHNQQSSPRPQVNPSSPAKIRIPSSLPTRQALLTGGAMLLNRASAFAAGAQGLGYADEIEGWVGDRLPSGLAPYYDGINDLNRNLRRMAPTGPVDNAGRLFNQLAAGGLGNPATVHPVAGLGQELMCQIFGVGCPTTTGGVPNLGGTAPAPPFTGGQSPGVPYRVQVRTNTVSNAGDPSSSDSTYINVPGPINGVRTAPLTTPEGARTGIYLDYGTAGESILIGSYLPEFFNSISPSILAVSRMDEQADTGGNPPPAPGTANRPATAPALANRSITPAPNAPIQPAATAPNPATTPLTPAPAPPGQTAPADPPQNDKPFDFPWTVLPLLGALPFLIPTALRGFNPSGARQRYQGPPSTRSTIDLGVGSCRYDSANIAGRVDQANYTLGIVNTVLQQQVLSKLDTLDQKLGPQIPNGGISGFFKKTWNFLQIDRVLNVLSWVGILHNAYMLSNGLAQTLFSGVGNLLNVIGIEDADGGSLDIGSIVAKWTDEFFKDIFGVETVDGIKATWKKYNRIYQAAANIINSIQSMVYSLVEILEIIQNYTGKIGNALLRSGTILANSFNWMNMNANYTNNRFFRFLQRAQDGLELIDEAASEILSIQETGEELFNQSEEFRKAVQEDETKAAIPENEAAGAQKKPLVKITPQQELRAEIEE